MNAVVQRPAGTLGETPGVAALRFYRPVQKVKYELPDMTGGVPILPVSGGADSSYLAILMHTLYPEVPWRLVFTDTGTLENPVEEPEIYESLNRLELYLGKKIERLIPELGLFELIEKFGGFLPGSGSRYCTRLLKQVPFVSWIKQFEDKEKYVFVGLRSDEPSRSGFTLEGVETVKPFVEMRMTREDIFRGLQETIGIPQFYKRRVRSGCAQCPFQRRAELVGLLQSKPEEFAKGERCEKIAANDLARWVEGIPLWKDSGVAANWQTLPIPDAGDIRGKKASRAPDLFGARIYVGGEFFTDGFLSDDEFVWHQRIVSVAPTLHAIKDQLSDRYEHLLATAEVFDMTPDCVRKKAKFAVWVVELPSEVFDPEGPREKGYTWAEGWAYAQLRHIVSWVTRALQAEGLRQQASMMVKSDLSVEYEWREESQQALQRTTEELGHVLASQWFVPSEHKRKEEQEEQVKYSPCPMCSM